MASVVADVLVMKLGRPAPSWSCANLVKEGEARSAISGGDQRRRM